MVKVAGISFLCLPAICWAASILEADWTAVSFNSESGYSVDIATDKSRHISRLVVRHGHKRIDIPRSAYADIVYPSLKDVHFVDYRGGAYGLEIKVFVFEGGGGRAEHKRIWLFGIEGDRFTGVESRLEAVDANGN